MLTEQRTDAATIVAAATALTGTAIAGRRVTEPALAGWYQRLDKPAFTPPGWVFGVVWPLLYASMLWSLTRSVRMPHDERRNTALALWTGQLLTNAAWTPLFFGRHRIGAALLDLGATKALTFAYIATCWRRDRTAAALMIPYLGWLGFAGLLNLEVYRRNR